ncbi:YgiQ family radical SAM protein [Fundidesulfovibrio butyratiphilus]
MPESSPRTSRPALRQPRFLPMSAEEMHALDWAELDVLLISGDAYVDHPSFGVPLLGRWLVAHGLRTGICAQPGWTDPSALLSMGRPRLFVGVSAGALDSMLAHYTAFRKKRSEDAYTPGGQAGARPNRAATVYANLARRAFPGLPVVLGGIEASLRRVSHYDFWTDALRRSIVLDAKATAVLYGMAEHSLLALARALDQTPNPDPAALRALVSRLPGAAFAGRTEDVPQGMPVLTLPSHEAIHADPRLLVEATSLLERHVHQDTHVAVQPSGDRLVILTPPGRGIEGADLDALAELPFTREPHPVYTKPIPATAMMRTSLTTHRGCAGGCSFCALALHQGRRVRSRSRDSVLNEAARFRDLAGFTGSISDAGGPSANMWGARCLGDPSRCVRPSCLTPSLCPQFSLDQNGYVDLLDALKALPHVRHVRVASGWRMDLALEDPRAMERMVRDYVGGQAKVAPEHISPHVLALMRKPGFAVFEEFRRLFEAQSARAGKKQYLIPYLMSAFPGCTRQDMRDMADWLRQNGWKPEQVQCFIPLPGTMAAAMFFARVDTKGRPLYVETTDAGRLAQHGLLAGPRRNAERRHDIDHQEGTAHAHNGQPSRARKEAPTPFAGARRHSSGRFKNTDDAKRNTSRSTRTGAPRKRNG